LPFLLTSNTMMGILFSWQSENAAASITLSCILSASMYVSLGRRFASGYFSGSLSYIPSTFVALIRHSAPISEALSAAVVSVEK